MKSISRFTASSFFWLFLFFAAATTLSAQTPAKAPTGSIIDLQVAAPSLKGNLLGDPTTQHVFVYLPPSYKTELSRRFPTLYLLHGYNGRPEEWIKDAYQGMDLRTEIDSLIAKGIAAEMIVVVPNGSNAYLGSFYTNSVVTGNWEDYMTRDLVSYIDKNYRTLARSSSRGIAGHSMGGYGAFMLAMKHPDLFGATYALSPCCLGFEGDMTSDNPNWAKAAKVISRGIYAKEPESYDTFWAEIMVAISAAFSPNLEKKPMYGDLPFVAKDGVLVKSEPAYSNFRAKMPLYLIEQYRENLMGLRGIFMDVGEVDEFSHIRLGTAKLSTALSERGIPHTFEIYKGGDHGNKIRERFDSKLIPFFSTVLEK